MCGFYAELRWGAAAEGSPARLEPVLSALAHRGPDASGTAHCAGAGWSAGLAHTRLKIIDLSERAAQPMHSRDGRHVLVFNGEIYGFARLRSALEERGVHFHSASDTEVLLEALRTWGDGALQRLDGMFAFALLDRRDGSMLLARDRMGIKPFYYHHQAGWFAAASEVRALHAAGVPFRPEAAGIASFLAFGSVAGPGSACREVRELLPGHLLMVSGAGDRLERYWGAEDDGPRRPASREEAVRLVRERLDAAIETHLVSDVPLGVFLSGGMDSGALVALGSAQRRGNIDAFTVGLPAEDSHIDETEVAASQAKAYRARHHRILLTAEDALASMDAWFEALDQPSIDGFNTYIVSQAVRRAGVTVALSGLGADELFGGYAHLRRSRLALAAMKVAWPLRRAFAPGSPVWRWIGGHGGRTDKVLAIAGADDAAARYAAQRALFVLPAVKDLIAEPYQEAWCGGGNRAFLSGRVGDFGMLRSQSLLELHNYLPNTLLRDTDVMSMRHGLEVRVPFLDRALVELVLSLPPEWVVQRGRIKPLLADAVKGLVPPTRIKLGFNLPFPRWLRGPMRTDVERRFARLEWAGEYLTVRGAAAQWRRLLAGDDRAWTRVWAIYVLDRWLQRQATQAAVAQRE